MDNIWEDMISLNSRVNPNFTVLEPAKTYWPEDARRPDFEHLDYMEALSRDTFPLPETKDREGYYGPHHFGYWASGFEDAGNLLKAADAHGINVRDYLDMGCASGRVIRHFGLSDRGINTMGCDINRLHVEWCNRYLPKQISVFQNYSIPSLPIADNSFDLVSAFSVFTHIEAFETSWLMELNRILRPGGMAYITVHTEHTLTEMRESWPLWKAVMNHPDIDKMLDDKRQFSGDRLAVRWHSARSYSSNVFYKLDYLHEVWGKFLEILEVRRRFPNFQDVLICRTRKTGGRGAELKGADSLVIER